MVHSVRTGDDGALLITLRGPIDDAEAAALRATLIDVNWRDQSRHVVVAVRRGVAIDATVVGSLVAADGVASDQNTVVEFRCEDPSVRDQLAAVGLRAA